MAYFGDAEIAQHHQAVLQKYVLSLQIAVQYVARMHIMQCESHLNEVVQHVIFGQQHACNNVDKASQQGALADLITGSALKQLSSTPTLLLLEIRCQISSIAEGHHNAEVVLLRIDE